MDDLLRSAWIRSIGIHKEATGHHEKRSAWTCQGSGAKFGHMTVSGGALRVQRKIWAAADFQNFLARPNRPL